MSDRDYQVDAANADEAALRERVRELEGQHPVKFTESDSVKTLAHQLAASQAQVEELRGAISVLHCLTIPVGIKKRSHTEDCVKCNTLERIKSPHAALERRDRETWNRAIEACIEVVNHYARTWYAKPKLEELKRHAPDCTLKRTEPECEVPDLSRDS